jgi:hypothetical protein
MSAAGKQILQQHKASLVALWINDPHELVFVTPRTDRNIYDDLIGSRWKQSLQRCGIKRRRLYAQRYSFLSPASVMDTSHADLVQIAGHNTQMLLQTNA